MLPLMRRAFSTRIRDVRPRLDFGQLSKDRETVKLMMQQRRAAGDVDRVLELKQE
jgi:hypothetical protein